VDVGDGVHPGVPSVFRLPRGRLPMYRLPALRP
jgi:hypothetical protein